MAAAVRVGTIVRVELHGRRVGGWVVDIVDDPTTDRPLKPIAKVTGRGPSPDIVALTEWAAWRWAGRRSAFLRAASPVGAVKPELRPVGVAGPTATGLSSEESVDVVRIAPAGDRLALILDALRAGPALIVTPSASSAADLAARLRRRGEAVALVPDDWARAALGAITVVGARGAAWAPAPDARTIIVLDEHDEGLQDERAPTWHAREVCIERARRAGIKCVAVSPCPSLEVLNLVRGRMDSTPHAEREGWAPVEVIDMLQEDPAAGLYPPRLTNLVRSDKRVLCVLNRKGGARLLACKACGALARCGRCSAAAEQADDGLACARCGEHRPRLCLECGATTLKALRIGTARVREQLEALAGEPVGEVTATTKTLPDTRLLVGTEAVLHRVERADVVAFLDFDHELFAPRFRATEQAMALLARAARVVGGRRRGGRVVVQTRTPDHEVLEAAVRGDTGLIVKPEVQRRIDLFMPPFSALAQISGEVSHVYVESLPDTLEVRGPAGDSWIVRAQTHEILCDGLAATPRPSGRLRIEVDPLRL
jgi:primosomal protein N' (replication factor Y) (superfamily II helicase)